MRTIILAILIFFSIGLKGQQNTLAPISPNEQFEIVLNPKDIGDLVLKFSSYLLDRKSADTLYLGTNLRHDLPPPNWFWDKDSKYLIFEKSEYGNQAKIQIWDLEKKEVMSTLNGAIPFHRQAAGQFWDSEHEVLFFFDFGNRDKKELPRLIKWEVSKKQLSPLYTFTSYFELEFPLIKTNHEERTLNIEGFTIIY